MEWKENLTQGCTPLVEMNADRKEGGRVKRIEVSLLRNKTRSSSAQNTFRNVFRVPEGKKYSGKENLGRIEVTEIKVSNRKLGLSPLRPKHFNEVDYLSKMCKDMMKNHMALKKQLESQEKIIKNYSNPAVKLFPHDGQKVKHVPDLTSNFTMTFRPILTRKQVRFPREIFK